MAQIATDELQEINALRNKLAVTVTEAGQVSLQIELLESDIVELKAKFLEHTQAFKKLLDEEQILIKRLSEKYGTGSINFETGEFTPDR